MQKTCTVCGETKDIKEFAYRSKAKGTRRPRCRECLRAYNREHYRRNKAQYKARAARMIKKVRARNYTQIFQYLSGKQCRDCEETDPRVLQFHHPKDNKGANVSQLARGCAAGRLQREMEKCEILCANCHFLHHFRQNGGHPFEKLGLM